MEFGGGGVAVVAVVVVVLSVFVFGGRGASQLPGVCVASAGNGGESASGGGK